MKRIIILITLIVILPFLLFSQNISNLDKKNGFNIFRLGEDISMYQDKLIFDMEDGQTSLYTYKKANLFYGASIKEITLLFYKNKLASITVSYGEVQQKDDEAIIYKLEQVFGVVSKQYNTFSSIKWGMQWKGKNVLLQLQKYTYDNEIFPNETHFFIQSIEKIKKQEYDEF